MKKFYCLLVLVCFSTLAFAQYPLVTIDSIQYIAPDTLLLPKTVSSFAGDTVRVRGVVKFDPRRSVLSTNFKNTYLLDTASTGVWKGLNVRLVNQIDSVAFFDNVIPGNIVEVTGVVSDFTNGNPVPSGETQIDILPGIAPSVVGFATPPAPRIVTINQFMQNDGTGNQLIQYATGEPYEGMYVEFQNVAIVNVSTFGGGRVSWQIQDPQGNRIFVRDVSAFFRPPFISSTASVPINSSAPVFVQQGKVFSYVRGVITETYFAGGSSAGNQYQLVPLDTTDLGPVSASPPFVASVNPAPAVPTSTQSVDINAVIEDLDGSVVSAQLFYAVGLNSTNFTSTPMLQVGNNWVGTIPAQPNLSYVKYYIRAVDNDTNVTIFPDTLGTGQLYQVLDAGITKISQIQETIFANGNSIYFNKTIDQNLNIRAVVTARNAPNNLGLVTIQDDTAPFSGIFLGSGQANVDTLRIGDSILVTSARVFENFNVTTLGDVTFQLISRGNALPAFANLDIDSVIARSYNSTEAYEGMLVEFNDVFVVNQNPDAPGQFGEWSIYKDTSTTVGLRCDDQSFDIQANFALDSLSLNQELGFLRGVLTFSFGNWKVWPRNRSDIEGYNTPISLNVGNISKNGIELTVFPNPSNGTLNIRFDEEVRNALSIEVMDIQGKVVARRNAVLANNGIVTLELSNLPNGIYMGRISNSQVAETFRFVVSK